MLRRSFIPLPSLVRAAAFGGALLTAAVGAACGNISLTNELPSNAGVSSSPAVDASPEGGLPLAAIDASTASGGNPPIASSDAGVAQVSSGNPLCFYNYAMDGGAHTCKPDTSSQCAVSPDAGVYSPSGPYDDGGDGGAPLSACHVVAKAQMCTAPGPGGDGAQCQTGADCADSFECVGSPGECRHYCCDGNSSCESASNVTTGATFCDVQTTPGGLNVPVCEPVTNCTPLLAGTCPQGETCAVVKDDGTASCVTIGTVGIQGSCDVFHCAAELTCLGAVGSRTCYQLCEVDAPVCPKGTACTSSAQLFTNANVGICQ